MADSNNPWGPRGGGKKPNKDLEEWLKGFQNLFGKKKKPNPWGEPPKPNQPGTPNVNLGLLVLAALVIFLLVRSVYQIQPGEQGVVLRFGQFHQTSGPGLNFVIPFIEKVIKVDVETLRKEEFASRRTSNAEFGMRDGTAADQESLMLTSDFNVVQINWVVQYKIRDAEHFLFNIENPRAVVRDISESVIRRLVGNRDFNYVLNNREELGLATMEEMQDLLDKY